MNRSYGIVSLAMALLFLAACQKGKERKTPSGFRYIEYKASPGNHAKLGDYVTLEMVYKTAKDSVLFDSRQNAMPMRFQLEKIPFQGSFEEGLTCLAAGDSATFFVPADSLFAYLIRKTGQKVNQEETPFEKGSFLKFDIKLLKIQDIVEAEQEIAMQMSAREKKEKSSILDFLAKHAGDFQLDSAGYYFKVLKEGTGATADSGTTLIVKYTGKFLSGTVFGGTKQNSEPYRFVCGQRQVIPGLDLLGVKLRAGEKVTVLFPSRLAYGEEGLRNPDDGTFIVPPYSPLIFELEVLELQPAVSIAKK